MIRSAVDFIRDVTRVSPRPWMVLGKGPTSDYICRIDPSEYHILTLNHACKVTVPTIAHFVDVEAYEDCVENLIDVSKTAICLPWYPHWHNKPQCGNLFDLTLYTPPLKTMAGKSPLSDGGKRLILATEREKLMLSYNASTAGKQKPGKNLPNIELRYFSAVAAFNLLARADVKEVHTLGVDGGIGYGDAFDKKDCLSNGQSSFDIGIREIVRTVQKNGMRWLKLGQMLDTLEKRS